MKVSRFVVCGEFEEWELTEEDDPDDGEEDEEEVLKGN